VDSKNKKLFFYSSPSLYELVLNKVKEDTFTHQFLAQTRLPDGGQA
jgi:hypothetical protein